MDKAKRVDAEILRDLAVRKVLRVWKDNHRAEYWHLRSSLSRLTQPLEDLEHWQGQLDDQRNREADEALDEGYRSGDLCDGSCRRQDRDGVLP